MVNLCNKCQEILYRILTEQLGEKTFAKLYARKEKCPIKRLRAVLQTAYVKRTLLRLYYTKDFEMQWNKLVQSATKGYCKIESIDYSAAYWNTTIMHSCIGYILSALCHGYLPVVAVCSPQGTNTWESFYRQPFLSAEYLADSFSRQQVEEFPVWTLHYDADIKMEVDKEKDKQCLQYWRNIYAKLAVLNTKTQEYVRCDEAAAFAQQDINKCLGVLCRGTDYVARIPKNHFRQPPVEEMLQKVERLYKEWNCTGIYLATEDGSIARQFKERFPGKIVENKRTYYDDIYYGKKITAIADVHFNRENDDYYKGLEYLSSMYILSHCAFLAAGRCGGTTFAQMVKNENWQGCFLFECGRYV